MSLKISVVFILLSLVHCYSQYGIQVERILTHPNEIVYRDEGSNVSFEWNFQIGSWPDPQPKVVEFVFGEWARPGYVRKKLLRVRGHNQVHKRRRFKKKVDWRGNIYECVNCTAVVVIYNLTCADFKSYGVNIELGVDRSPLTNWLRLVKREPASITKWTQNIEVHEGDSTIIECRASGLPPPSVKIKRNYQTLKTCNDMKPCVFKIQAARPEDQGEYVCLVQQGNSSVIISRFLNLTVLKTRKTKTTVEAKQPYLDRFLNYPNEIVYRDEGSNVSFEWNFQIGSWPNPRPKVVEFVFGECARPGYVRKKILNVQGHNQVHKRRRFKKKVDWRGNVYECVNCTAVVVMYNLTLADFKSYGVGIELGVNRSPLTNWLRLVKREPASITKWTQNIEVHEGDSTIIECRASGLPPPSVKIKRNYQTLKTCNDMKPCVFKIQAARSEDQGEYVCLVQQRNSSVIISRSLNLTVLKTRRSSTKTVIDERLSPNTPSAFSPSTSSHSHSVNTMQWGWSAYLAIPAVVLVVIVLIAVPLFYVKNKERKTYKFEDEGKAFEIK